MPQAAMAALLHLQHTQRSLEPGQFIARDAEPARFCFLLVAGFAMRHKIVSGGRRQILSVDLSGDVLNLDALYAGSCDYNVQALSACTIVEIDRVALLEVLASHVSISQALALELVRQSAIYREWLANLGSRDARTRVAHLLCEIGMRLERADLSDRHSYELPMTQEQLADAMGLSLIHIARTLKALEAEGLIGRERRAIQVGDWERLKSAGDFNPFYLSLAE
jgi:CRP-like cAMP-binding protein